MQLLDQPRVDRDKSVIRHVHVLGNVSKHGHRYATEAQKEVCWRYEGMPVGIDHLDGPRRVADSFGTLRNPSVDAEGTWADLHYLKSSKWAPRILEDIERGTGLFSLSAVSTHVTERHGVVTSFRPVGVDIVVGGATTGTLLEQYSPDIEQLGGVRHRLAAVESRIALHEQFVQTAGLQRTIADVIGDIDLSKFHPAVPQTEAQFLRNHFAPAIDNASQFAAAQTAVFQGHGIPEAGPLHPEIGEYKRRWGIQ